MKRIYTFVLSALIAFVFTTAHAQRNIFIWKDGNISVKSASEIDSITSSVGSWLFSIRTSAATSVTTNTLEASVSVAFANNVRSLSQTPEVGVCFSSTSVTPTYADERTRLGSSVTNYDFTLYDLDPGTTYYYRAYVKLGDEVFYGNVRSIMTFGEKPPTLINGHKFVDLGLPSGLLWAETNVGASSASDDGDYFAWGETSPKSLYSWSTYKWDSYPPSKYNSSDDKTTLDAADDAATVNWGAPCRMPDSSEFQELHDKCDWSWQGNGYTVTGPNGNTLFFPASGYRYDDDLRYHGSDGYYWSRTLNSSSTDCARYLCFYSGFVYPSDGYRYKGFSVRPVAKK